MSWLWFPLVLATTVTVIWLHWRIKNKMIIKLSKQFSGPPPLPVIGNGLMFMVNPEELVRVIWRLKKVYGEVFRVWLGPELNIVLSDPNQLKILLTSPKANAKGPQYRFMADILGGGILSGSGPTWRKHRKIATPNYGKRAIQSYGEIFNSEVTMLMERLWPLANGEQFDIYKYIVKTTSRSVCQTLMGLSTEETSSLPYFQEIVDKTPRLYDIIFDRMTKWNQQINCLYWLVGPYKEQKQFVEYITEFSKKIKELRQQKLKTMQGVNLKDLMNSENDSLLNTQLSVIDRFILSEELHGDELLQEIFTIFTSSQEASAKITSFILLMMAYHPDCQEKLYTEIKDVMGDEERSVTGDDLKKMPYLDMVFKEVLRLYPIGAMLQRTVTEDVAIGSYILPAGCSVVIPVYHLHRDPRYWVNPNEFNPERFTAENVKLRPTNCYIPFSLGPMDCLGRYFGIKLIKTTCVRILREFKLSSWNTYTDLRLSIAISASSIDGYQIILKPRY